MWPQQGLAGFCGERPNVTAFLLSRRQAGDEGTVISVGAPWGLRSSLDLTLPPEAALSQVEWAKGGDVSPGPDPTFLGET